MERSAALNLFTEISRQQSALLIMKAAHFKNAFMKLFVALIFF